MRGNKSIAKKALMVCDLARGGALEQESSKYEESRHCDGNVAPCADLMWESSDMDENHPQRCQIADAVYCWIWFHGRRHVLCNGDGLQQSCFILQVQCLYAKVLMKSSALVFTCCCAGQILLCGEANLPWHFVLG